jgi:hypothetical protein
MDYQNEALTKVLSHVDYDQMLDEIVAIIEQNRMASIELVFGSAWGNVYKDWKQFSVNADSIRAEIKIAENLKVGNFGADDLFIICPPFNVEILFCHERDIHLRYNDTNQLVLDILQLWKDKSLLHFERQLT